MILIVFTIMFFSIEAYCQSEGKYDKGTIIIYSDEEETKVKIPKLSFEAETVGPGGICIPGVPASYYRFEFRHFKTTLQGSLYVPWKDTLLILVDFKYKRLKGIRPEEYIYIKRQKQTESWYLKFLEYKESSGIDSLEFSDDENIYLEAFLEEIYPEQNICRKPDEMPLFRGGDPETEIRRFVEGNIRYPEEAAESGFSGQVIVYYIIDENGNVFDPVVLKSAHPALDEETIRIIKATSGYTPGKKDGQPVKTGRTFSLNFYLN